MSRTDKDAPTWVLATYFEPAHNGCEFRGRSWDRSARRECDLPERPVREKPFMHGWRGAVRRCHWAIHWDRDLDARRGWPPRNCPRWFVRHAFHAPMRVEARDVLRAAAKEWRGSGETDLEPTPRQGRHSAQRDYW